MMSMCIFPSEQNRLASHQEVSLAQNQKDKRCKSIPKKKRGRMTRWTPQRLKAAPKNQTLFSLVAPQPTVRSSRKSRYLMEDGVWRGCCRSFSAPPAPAGLPFLGAMRPLRTPNSCAPPFWRGLVSGQTEFCSTQPRPCLDQVLCSSIFHLAHCARQYRQAPRQRAFPRAADMAAVVAERQ